MKQPDESPENSAERKKPVHKGDLSYESVFEMTDGKQLGGCLGLKRGGGGRRKVSCSGATCGTLVAMEMCWVHPQDRFSGGEDVSTGESDMGSLCYFTTTCESTMISKRLI